VDVAIAGGHGKVALRALRLLAAEGEPARGLIRNPDHAADVEAAGAEAVLCDLEELEPAQIAPLIEGADAVVFAAGAGPGSGPERKRTVDYGGAVKLIEAAELAGIGRYVMVSAMEVDHPERWSDEIRPYNQAKADADAELEASGLDYTIVRPGRLTDEAGTDLIEAAPDLRFGEIPRDDVAATLAACLVEPATAGKAFDVIAGGTPIGEALRSL
jgi:uncharacterized protein YbjT (DUF2867 family)